ncbi:hypothetical protein Moror_13110 [Moniliophthora roreri MCA 2997]|uniref:Uncharacterized protein n=1 Tax=Moniliophthora roreri (strain MCA 2997) TaxID=1381753 RepID=V2YBF8_MONRO|nr:hypothetical protein Moror_13110 [Moniliophthora roreri MCA 2997]
MTPGCVPSSPDNGIFAENSGTLVHSLMARLIFRQQHRIGASTVIHTKLSSAFLLQSSPRAPVHPDHNRCVHENSVVTRIQDADPFRTIFSHIHKPDAQCDCNQEIRVERQTVNTWYTVCDNCKRVELDRRVGRKY